MAVDWDAALLAPLEAAFARCVVYERPGEPAFDLPAVFDRRHAEAPFGVGAAPVSTLAPRVFARLAAFPCGFRPRPGDRVQVDGQTFAVADVQADAMGGVTLPLTARRADDDP